MTLFDSDSAQNDEGSVARGFLLGSGANLIVCAVGLGTGFGLAESDSGIVHVIGVLLNYAVGAISLTQFTYMLPLYRHFKKIGAHDSAKGIVIAGAVTALLSCGCWLILIANFNKF